MKIAVIQLNSVSDKLENLRKVELLLTQAYDQCQPDLIALPEMFTFMGGSPEEKKRAAEKIDDDSEGEAFNLLKELAKQFSVVIHGGSLCEQRDGQFFNTTCVIDAQGKLITTYRKIKLFQFSGVQNSNYNESELISSGDRVVTYPHQEMTIGCAICFDLRFGEIFQQLIQKQTDVIIIPSAFTYETGQAHWEILCRARAIETQSFLVAPAQTGSYIENGMKKSTWGHSMIIDPWGNIMETLYEEEGFICANLDKENLIKIRERLPVVTQIVEKSRTILSGY